MDVPVDNPDNVSAAQESGTCLEEVTRTRVVLVDDVATTGATLAACAAVARAAGAREVTALVFARTIGR